MRDIFGITMEKDDFDIAAGGDFPDREADAIAADKLVLMIWQINICGRVSQRTLWMVDQLPL